MEKEIFKGTTAKNWKQENALNSIFKDNSGRSYDKKKDIFPEETEIIYSYLKEFIDVKDYCSCHYFYLLEMLPLGDILIYKNVKLQSIYINSPEAKIVFNVQFEIENPHIDKIDELKKIDKSFEKLSEEEFLKRETEWKENFDKLRLYDQYIGDFTYAYIYDLPKEKLSEIIEVIKKPEYKEYAIMAIQKINKRRKLQQSSNFDTMTYAQKLDYWDLWDEVHDIISSKKPDEKELLSRKERREVPEETYNIQTERNSKLIAEIMKKIQ